MHSSEKCVWGWCKSDYAPSFEGGGGWPLPLFTSVITLFPDIIYRIFYIYMAYNMCSSGICWLSTKLTWFVRLGGGGNMAELN